jgi:hypothetical protein
VELFVQKNPEAVHAEKSHPNFPAFVKRLLSFPYSAAHLKMTFLNFILLCTVEQKLVQTHCGLSEAREDI